MPLCCFGGDPRDFALPYNNGNQTHKFDFLYHALPIDRPFLVTNSDHELLCSLDKDRRLRMGVTDPQGMLTPPSLWYIHVYPNP
jgi:hypothetical protein